MPASLAVILLNYKRPQNIGAIVAAARAALPEATIYLRDQGEDAGFRDRQDIAWDEVVFQRGGNRGAGVRVPMAIERGHDLYLAIDDDTILNPWQIETLVERLAAEPDRAHGVWGERVEYANGKMGFRSRVVCVNGPLSVLNQVYAFSRAQAERAVALAARLGWPDWDDIGPIDDILLSCASAKPPLCHHLGDLQICVTADEPGVAVWRTHDFRPRRAEVAARLVAMRAIAVFGPMVLDGAA